MIRAILTDIEGTTSSIQFVKDVLFPYARKRLPAFVETHADRPEVRHWLHEAAKEAGLVAASRAELIALLQCWIDQDRKATSLKALQGMIWEEGYTAGDFLAHVYPEVPARLRAWRQRGLRLYVFSSGSVPAQQLFFRYSEAGDLSSLFDGYFDTEIGAKREVESYRRIAVAIGCRVRDVLFLSDVIEELDAAATAGMHTTLIARPPAQCPHDAAHPCTIDFDGVKLEPSP